VGVPFRGWLISVADDGSGLIPSGRAGAPVPRIGRPDGRWPVHQVGVVAEMGGTHQP